MKKTLLYVAASLLLVTSTGCTKLTGNGEKVGTVIKVSQEGLFFKTNEVEIVRGGMNGGSGAFSTTPLNATVNDDELFQKLKDALNNQYEVRVYYRDYLWTPLSSDSNSRYIVAMDKLERRKDEQCGGGTQNLTIQNPKIEVKDGKLIISNGQ